MHNTPLAAYQAQHFLWAVEDGVATITLNRPERKNPLTFDSYAELRDLFRALVYADDVHAVVVRGAGGNFCSGGDVHEIIGPLTEMNMKQLLAFTRMTGDLVKAMRACPQPVISAVEGVCAGAGAIIAMSSDLRYAAANAKVAFLFNRVGLAGCDMGACAILPRLIGQGRASELLYSGRSLKAEEGERWGFFNSVSDDPYAAAMGMARAIVKGPTFANGITKTQLQQEWNMSVDQAIETEAQAQALCMQTEDFRRAYNAFVAKQTPVFEGN
ncbi:enoyl-CoA hydratase family protein [Kineobactrum salinum]|uniref:Enoyl-CoA hydratase family protein n=1 Tax=Kineobactrum salinum TaxID=2708301 RepID=A0A6C0TY07_9GAMM|nr:enoyl-CoA hydratase family protein [Kineobactrum salinum]QIB64518.1 enoyl-CoA hydratase family protein [Kineobactrum salinum]